MSKYTLESFIERLFIGIDRSDSNSCWIFKARTVDKDGYARIRQNYIYKRVHRASWELKNGKIPKGMLVCHKCDVRLCINPNHLFLGTQKDNMRDMVNKNQAINNRRGEKHNKAKLKESDVITIRELRKLGTPCRKIAKIYKMDNSTIHDIVNYTLWKLVP